MLVERKSMGTGHKLTIGNDGCSLEFIEDSRFLEEGLHLFVSRLFVSLNHRVSSSEFY